MSSGDEPTHPSVASLADPFAGGHDPAAYVPRRATDGAIEQILAAIGRPGGHALLVGEPGLGKTLILQVIASRLRTPTFCAYLPHAGLTPDELAGWALARLGLPQTDNPVGVLKALGQHLLEEGSSLVLLIDDADAMSLSTAKGLGEWVAAAGGAFRIVLASSKSAAVKRVSRVVAEDAKLVELTERMSEEETGRYIERRLDLACVPRVTRLRFNDATVRRLHEGSSGIPGKLLVLAAAELRRGSIPAEDPISAEPVVVREDEPTDPLEIPEPPVRPKAERERDYHDEQIPFDELLDRPEPPRVRAAPSQRNVVLGLVLLAALTVSIPLVRSLLPKAPDESIVAPPPPEPDATEPTPAADEPAPIAPPAPGESGLFQVQVNATPWASIRIDGVNVGDTPLAGIALIAGPHTIEARMADGRIIERVERIGADNRHISFE